MFHGTPLQVKSLEPLPHPPPKKKVRPLSITIVTKPTNATQHSFLISYAKVT